MLEVKGLIKDFGGLRAVNDVSFTLNKGEIMGLIGPNGAGKTTFFNLLTGYIRPTRGRVIFEGKDITGKKPHYIAKCGLIRTFQADNIFSEFTVLKNMILACHLNPMVNFWETVLHTPSGRRKDKEILEHSHQILEMLGLENMANIVAGSLPHGHKRLLGIAISLAADPQLLLLDEPLAGMNGEEVSATMQIIDKLWQNGLTILLIEHNMRAAMNLCHKIVVLNFGKKIAEGSPGEIKVNTDVVQAYLGTSESVAEVK
jgi:branched-chain amino acid transport system ATP-binding protein